MKPEAQRIAIAEACGWRATESPNWTGLRPDGRGWNGDLPDYLNDLNAMREAEAIIIKRGARVIRDYEDALQKHVANIVFATAAQRAEAFLRTLNLWTNDN